MCAIGTLDSGYEKTTTFYCSAIYVPIGNTVLNCAACYTILHAAFNKHSYIQGAANKSRVLLISQQRIGIFSLFKKITRLFPIHIYV